VFEDESSPAGKEYADEYAPSGALGEAATSSEDLTSMESKISSSYDVLKGSESDRSEWAPDLESPYATFFLDRSSLFGRPPIRLERSASRVLIENILVLHFLGI
jgi:hypothetical protein